MNGMLARNIVGFLAGIGLLVLVYLPTRDFFISLIITLPIHWFLMGEAYKVTRAKEDG